jgi:hypothetical protein
MADDPLQQHNLWDDPERAAIRSQLITAIADSYPASHSPRLAATAPV